MHHLSKLTNFHLERGHMLLLYSHTGPYVRPQFGGACIWNKPVGFSAAHYMHNPDYSLLWISMVSSVEFLFIFASSFLAIPTDDKYSAEIVPHTYSPVKHEESN